MQIGRGACWFQDNRPSRGERRRGIPSRAAMRMTATLLGHWETAQTPVACVAKCSDDAAWRQHLHDGRRPAPCWEHLLECAHTMFDIDVTHNIVREQADHAAVLMDGVASGRKPMQLIHSPSGFAKTAIAMKRFRAHGIVPPRSDGLALKPWQRMVLEARPTDAIVLVRKLFECVQRNAAVLLLDDPGKIAHDEDSLDVLKTGFGAQRTVMLETPQIVQNELWRLDRARQLQRADPTATFRYSRSAFSVAEQHRFYGPEVAQDDRRAF